MGLGFWDGGLEAMAAVDEEFRSESQYPDYGGSGYRISGLVLRVQSLRFIGLGRIG